jgi:pimeloyl-ACP methyl ester carboxylesterase
VHPPESSAHHAAFFTGPRIGHNPPQEDPGAFADAVLEMMRG